MQKFARRTQKFMYEKREFSRGKLKFGREKQKLAHVTQKLACGKREFARDSLADGQAFTNASMWHTNRKHGSCIKNIPVKLLILRNFTGIRPHRRLR